MNCPTDNPAAARTDPDAHQLIDVIELYTNSYLNKKPKTKQKYVFQK